MQLVERAQLRAWRPVGLRSWRVTLDNGAVYQLTDRDGPRATRIRRGC